MQEWLKTLASAFLDALPEGQHGDFLAAVERRLEAQLRDAAGGWTADYVRLRFLACKGRPT